ncbi:MAG: hypothetical protein CM15mP93_03990 [Thiotrichaceae bacterium]|nr:MAG: hypothetical protein CM15mP93_03990 [Thiotrichaceae bacterium]
MIKEKIMWKAVLADKERRGSERGRNKEKNKFLRKGFAKKKTRNPTSTVC